MEKFIKQYGILVLVGVAVYWFFIRKKDEEEVVVVDEEGEGSDYIYRGLTRAHRTGKGGKTCTYPRCGPTSNGYCWYCGDKPKPKGVRFKVGSSRSAGRRY